MFNIFTVMGTSVLALAFAAFLAIKILFKDDGTDRMEEIANAVKKGADAFLKRQYFVVSIFFVIGCCLNKPVVNVWPIPGRVSPWICG